MTKVPRDRWRNACLIFERNSRLMLPIVFAGCYVFSVIVSAFQFPLIGEGGYVIQRKYKRPY